MTTRTRLAAGAAAAALLLTQEGAHAQERGLLFRPDRQAVAVMTTAPDGIACRGVALISPGAGGSEQGYRYLGKALAAEGYLSVVIGHPHSGPEALREAWRRDGLWKGLAELSRDPRAYRSRLEDIAAARTWAASRCRGQEAVLIGHSMGAATALIEAGARNRLGLRGTTSFTATIALSPQGSGSIFPPNAWATVREPVLMITGTRDRELGGAPWTSRTEPFRSMPAGCAWLAVINDATHLQFAGRGGAGRTEALTTAVISSFLGSIRHSACRPPAPIRGLTLETK